MELSLIDGSWNVWSGGNVYVGEVRNPNGAFNGDQLTVPNGVFAGNIGSPNVPTRSSFLFNYAPNAAANFWGGRRHRACRRQPAARPGRKRKHAARLSARFDAQRRLRRHYS